MATMQSTVSYSPKDTQPKKLSTVLHPVMHLLMQGAMDRIQQAKESIIAKQYSQKAACINKSMGILSGLRVSLTHNNSVQIANQFDEFYDLMMGNLMLANKENNLSTLDEVIQLMKNIKCHWEEVSQY